MSKPCFSKVLVANRGEIAVRVMRTLREMGIRTVAVYSEADRHALHVRMADEAVAIGPAPSAESYLRIDRVIEACVQTRAQAVHPGYGFLSENPAFARACAEAGVVFIGPLPETMEAMGHKTAARERMIAANVPVVPGAHGSSAQELRDAAVSLGYPVMLKAAAGGGGKGMRLVHSPSELDEAYQRAQSEAQNAFGDATVYVEKAILQPRHVEIQVLADHQGEVVHLFERDCSVQRRHQKVIEETPSPALQDKPDIIARMGEVAVNAARAVNYRSAGTVEFLLSPSGEFYFLEMNTRLQVEHPVTELTTGLDLVREQVRVAAGEPLGFAQPDIERRGHAIECRIYAEDPSTGFLPSPGPLITLKSPGGPGVRDDSGAYAGSEISPFYDPLISKLCVWAETRELAVARMRRALTEYVAGGIETNIAFLIRVMDNPAFRSGDYTTGFIEEHKKSLTGEAVSDEMQRALAIAAAVACAREDISQSTNASSTHAEPTSKLSPWRTAR